VNHIASSYVGYWYYYENKNGFSSPKKKEMIARFDYEIKDPKGAGKSYPKLNEI
jgi:hypothetical protein